MKKCPPEIRARIIKRLRDRVALFAQSVYPLYQALGWEWADANGVPSPAKISDALEMGIDAIKYKYNYSSSGGLTVEIYEGDGGWTGRMAFTFETEVYGGEE